MACDIHFFVEVQLERGGAWLHVPSPDALRVLRGAQVYGEGVTAEAALDAVYRLCTQPAGETFDSLTERDYDLFHVLAGVRSYGREVVTPIAPHRGVPADASPMLREEIDAWGSDGHSHSWATLAEMIAFPWESSAYELTYFRDSVLRAMDSSGLPRDQVRAVFFFDN